MNEAVIKLILDTAGEHSKNDDDDFEVNDWAGGNIDDAYQIGIDTGVILFARTLKSLLDAT